MEQIKVPDWSEEAETFLRHMGWKREEHEVFGAYWWHPFAPHVKILDVQGCARKHGAIWDTYCETVRRGYKVPAAKEGKEEQR